MTDENTEVSGRYQWPDALNLHALAMQEPAAPGFIVDGWLPCDYATLFAGHGGAGKSGIALHLACCIALGRPFFGLPCAKRRVMYLSCEDRWPVLHWRLAHIARHLDIDLGELDGELVLLDLVGEETVLWEKDPKTGMTLTTGFACLQEKMTKNTAEVLFVDGISDTFAGNENARGDPKRYVNSLLSLIPPDGALVLIGHVAKPAASSPSTSEGYSGSTGWHNSVRARWYLYPERGDEDGKPSGELVLELQKSNHGPTAAAMRFTWDDQARMFIGRSAEAVGTMVDEIRDRSEREAILRAMQSAGASCIDIPAATTGRRTAYHVLSAQAAFPDSLRSGKPAVRRFWRHIEALRAMQHVKDGSIRRADRHSVVTLVPTAEGLRACGQ
ncbi:MAG: AAA family ATPase [Burkholderiales bacterium]